MSAPPKIPELGVQAARKRFDAADAIFVDVRDPNSYRQAHIPGALRVNDSEVEAFVAETDKAKTLIVYCYHGHSSLGGASYFLGKGFTDVFSLHGGFTAWHAAGAPSKVDETQSNESATEESPAEES